MMRAMMLGGVAVAMAMTSLTATADPWQTDQPWPSKIEGHTPIQPGEHPRLLFRKADLPRIRAFAKTPEGKKIVDRLRTILNGSDGESMPTKFQDATEPYPDGKYRHRDYKEDGYYTMSHAAGYGMLYQLTGDKKYADMGRKCFELAWEGKRDTDSRYSWDGPGGPLRGGPTLGWYALGYDLCYDGWDAEFQKKAAQAIQNYAGKTKKKPVTLDLLAGGKHQRPFSNHWGMIVGGGGMAVMAIYGDPGTDKKKLNKLLEANKKCMITKMTEGFGNGGFFAEGDGTGSMGSHIVFLTCLQAYQNAKGLDFVTPRSTARWISWRWQFLTLITEKGKIQFPDRGAYPHNIWARDDLSGAGYYVIPMGTEPDAQRAALRWHYEKYFKDRDDKAGHPWDTTSNYPHYAVLALANVPHDLAPIDPVKVVPRGFRDTKFGFYAFRNRWQDDNDIIISQLTKNARGWHKADRDRSVVIWHHGQKDTWGSFPTESTYFDTRQDGSTLFGNDTTAVAIDFSGASGCDGMIVIAGPGGGNGPSVTVGGETIAFKFLAGEGQTAPTPKVEGNVITVGGQTVTYTDGKLSLKVIAEPWTEQASVAKSATSSAPTHRDGPTAKAIPRPKLNDSAIANRRLGHARTYMKAGKADMAQTICTEIIKQYPGTSAAEAAQAMLDEMKATENKVDDPLKRFLN